MKRIPDVIKAFLSMLQMSLNHILNLFIADEILIIWIKWIACLIYSLFIMFNNGVVNYMQMHSTVWEWFVILIVLCL